MTDKATERLAEMRERDVPIKMAFKNRTSERARNHSFWMAADDRHSLLKLVEAWEPVILESGDHAALKAWKEFGDADT